MENKGVAAVRGTAVCAGRQGWQPQDHDPEEGEAAESSIKGASFCLVHNKAVNSLFFF